MFGVHAGNGAGYDMGGDDAICWLTMLSLPTTNPNATIPDTVGDIRDYTPRLMSVDGTRRLPSFTNPGFCVFESNSTG